MKVGHLHQLLCGPILHPRCHDVHFAILWDVCVDRVCGDLEQHCKGQGAQGPHHSGAVALALEGGDVAVGGAAQGGHRCSPPKREGGGLSPLQPPNAIPWHGSVNVLAAQQKDARQ